MKAKDLQVGLKVRVGTGADHLGSGEEAYVLDIEPKWDESRLSSWRSGRRYSKGYGRKVAIAKRARNFGPVDRDAMPEWAADVVALNGIVDHDEWEEGRRRYQAAEERGRQEEEQRKRAVANQTIDFDDRITALIGIAEDSFGFRHVRESGRGRSWTLSTDTLNAIITAAEKAVQDRLLDLQP